MKRVEDGNVLIEARDTPQLAAAMGYLVEYRGEVPHWRRAADTSFLQDVRAPLGAVGAGQMRGYFENFAQTKTSPDNVVKVLDVSRDTDQAAAALLYAGLGHVRREAIITIGLQVASHLMGQAALEVPSYVHPYRHIGRMRHLLQELFDARAFSYYDDFRQSEELAEVIYLFEAKEPHR